MLVKPLNGLKPERFPGVERKRENANSNDSGGKISDVAYMRQRLLGLGRESRHNVISRRDNLILTPDKAPGVQDEIPKVVQEIEVSVSCNYNYFI